MIIIGICLNLQARQISDPIDIARLNIKQISKGNFDINIAHNRYDEIGELYNDINLTAAFVLNEKSDTLRQKGGSDSVTLTQDNIPPHTHSYNFIQYNVGQNYCDSNGPYMVSGCYSGQDPSTNFPNTGMCDTNGGNCITSPNSSTPIKLDPPHIKLIYIMKIN